MKSFVDSFDAHHDASSRTKLRLHLLMRSCALLSILFLGCFYLSIIREAAAFPKVPALPAPATVSCTSTLPHEIYYNRGRYYPYRYRGAYYGHRYYRYGHWHYY